MPLYLDIHRLPEGVTPEKLKDAHFADVGIQDEHGVTYQGYFYNQAGGTVACLVHGPNRDACIEVHRRAHGLLAEKVIEVTADQVQAFLGGGTIPEEGDARLPDGTLDGGVRVLLVTELDNLGVVAARSGDAAALKLIEHHDALVREAVARHGGREVRHAGDGMMCCFPLASSAIACALAIQEAAGRASDVGETASIRIGLAAGEPVTRYESLFGTVVEQARVICRAAAPGEVLVSSTVRDLCAGKPLSFSSAHAVRTPGAPELLETFAAGPGAGSAGADAPPAAAARERLRRPDAALTHRYALEDEIGRGGMATVYSARDLKYDRRVAVKVLHPELAASIGSRRFLDEILVVARLSHPNIVPLYDSGEIDGRLYYVMPYLGGDTLRQIIRRDGRLTVSRAIEIVRGIAAALEHAHRQGIIHRDIKPENVMVLDGVSLVLDFGIALALTQAGGERMTRPGLAMGTLSYMSPEQLTGEPEVTPTTDVYALGCVLHELLAGEPPFVGASVQNLMTRIVCDPPVPLGDLRDDVPSQVQHAVRRALEKHPGDRFGSSREFVASLAS